MNDGRGDTAPGLPVEAVNALLINKHTIQHSPIPRLAIKHRCLNDNLL